jgi:hypothetical protein
MIIIAAAAADVAPVQIVKDRANENHKITTTTNHQRRD